MSATAAGPAPRKIGLAAYYNAVTRSRGFGLAPHHYPIISGLEDTRIENLLFLGSAGTGKSLLLDSIYASWVLGHDPTTSIIAVSAGEKLPQGFMAATMQIIQHDPAFRELFPDVRPAPDLGWSIQRGLFVTGHIPSDSDASYVSVGLSSKALTGLHCRLMILDDIHDRENSATPEGRAQVKSTFYDTLMGRADPRGCRRVAAGRWWADDDLYQEWIVNGDWVVLQLPASRPGQTRLWYDVLVPKGLTCVYTETLEPDPVQDPDGPYVRYRAYYAAVDPTRKGFYWPGSPSKRKEYETVKRRQPRTAAINYDGDMTAGRDAVFREEDFPAFVPPCDLSLGRSGPGFAEWLSGMKGQVKQAWDTALGQPQSESLTVALTGMLVPCSSWHCGEDEAVVGACDFHFDVWLLWASVRDVDFRELAMMLRTEHGLWFPDEVIVEEKQSGVSLLQTFRGGHIPIRGQQVEQGKIDRAINPIIKDDRGAPIPGGAASVQGWARMGRIRRPVDAPWIEKGPDGEAETGFMKRIVSYHGGRRGSDEFDTLVHLVTRAIVRSRKHGYIAAASAALLDPLPSSVADDPRRAVFEQFGLLGSFHPNGSNAAAMPTPFDGLCGAPCVHYGVVENRTWCALHGRPTQSIDGCSSWRRRTVSDSAAILQSVA